MTAKKDFVIDQRVSIAMNALTDRQKAPLELILQSKEKFIEYANSTGKSKKLASEKPIYVMKAGKAYRIFYSKMDDEIHVLDIMNKAVIDYFSSSNKRKSKDTSAKKRPVTHP